MKTFILKQTKSILLASFMLGLSAQAQATTDCWGRVSSSYVGQGIYYMVFHPDSGAAALSASMPTTLADTKYVIMTVQANKTLSKKVGLRFNANVSCSSLGTTRTDVIGAWN